MVSRIFAVWLLRQLTILTAVISLKLFRVTDTRACRWKLITMKDVCGMYLVAGRS